MIISGTFLGSSASAPFCNIYEAQTYPCNSARGQRKKPPLDAGPICWGFSWKSEQGPRFCTPILINSFIHLLNKYLMSVY